MAPADCVRTEQKPPELRRQLHLTDTWWPEEHVGALVLSEVTFLAGKQAQGSNLHLHLCTAQTQGLSSQKHSPPPKENG